VDNATAFAMRNVNDPNGGVAVGIGVGVSFFVLIVVVSVIAFFLIRRRRRSKLSKVAVVPIPIQELSKEVNSSELIAFEEISIGPVLGSGQFGQVLYGDWGSVSVALKWLKTENYKALQQELLITMKLNHPNIVRFFGVTTPNNSIQYIVTEFCDSGDLRNFMLQRNNISGDQLAFVAVNIARGMNYLHNAGVIHRDLAARNVLLVKQKDTYIPKVADFGMSKKADNYYAASEGHQFAVRWGAPEVCLKMKFSKSSDVWSFGVVLWEMYESGTIPYPQWDNATVIQEVTKNGTILPKPQTCPDEIWDVMRRCFDTKEDGRPNFKEILSQLQSMAPTEVTKEEPQTESEVKEGSQHFYLKMAP